MREAMRTRPTGNMRPQPRMARRAQASPATVEAREKEGVVVMTNELLQMRCGLSNAGRNADGNRTKSIVVDCNRGIETQRG